MFLLLIAHCGIIQEDCCFFSHDSVQVSCLYPEAVYLTVVWYYIWMWLFIPLQNFIINTCFMNSIPRNDKIIVGLCCEHAYKVNFNVFYHKCFFFYNLKLKIWYTKHFVKFHVWVFICCHINKIKFIVD